MVSFCADIDRLFTEAPFLQRFRLARENGFSSVEFSYPENVDLGCLGDAAAYKGLKVSLISMPLNQAALAFEKKEKQNFLNAFDVLLERADFLECKKIFIPGKIVLLKDFDALRLSFVSALHAIAPRARQSGVKILLGFKNPTENPDFYPASTLEVLELLDELNDDRVFAYLFEVYHAQMCEGGISNTIEALISLIAHVRIAGVPNAAEPDSGEIDYSYVLSLLETQGYQGHVSCSYTPRLETLQGLKWMTRYV